MRLRKDTTHVDKGRAGQVITHVRSLISMVEYGEGIVATRRKGLKRADCSSLELLLLAVAPPSLLLLSGSWPETDCTLCNPRRLAQMLMGNGFACVQRRSTFQCRRGQTQRWRLRRRRDWSPEKDCTFKEYHYHGKDGGSGIGGLNLQDRSRRLSLGGRPQARHSKAEDVDRLPHLQNEDA